MYVSIRALSCKSPSIVCERIGLQHYPTTNATKRLLWFGSGLALPPRAYLAVSGVASGPVRISEAHG